MKDYSNPSNKFSLSLNVRIIEDRYNNSQFQDFKNNFRQKLKNKPQEKSTLPAPALNLVKIIAIPGRMDYSIRFDKQMNFEILEFQDLLMAISADENHLDRVQTNIGLEEEE